MKKALIISLEDLLNEKDPQKLQERKESVVAHIFADKERIMAQVNLYIATRSPESKKYWKEYWKASRTHSTFPTKK